MKFIQTELEKHSIVNIDTIASINIYMSKNEYDSRISFFTPQGQNVAEWAFTNEQLPLMKETIENLKDLINIIDINNIVKL